MFMPIMIICKHLLSILPLNALLSGYILITPGVCLLFLDMASLSSYRLLVLKLICWTVISGTKLNISFTALNADHQWLAL